MIRQLIALSFILLALSSCHRDMLDVETQFFSYQDLASARVRTPDPNKQKAGFPEERLAVTWKIPERDYVAGKMSLEVTIRSYLRENETEVIQLDSPKGVFTLRIPYEKYKRLGGGIATYKVSLFKKGKLLDSVEHPIWADFLEIED